MLTIGATTEASPQLEKGGGAPGAAAGTARLDRHWGQCVGVGALGSIRKPQWWQSDMREAAEQ